MASAGLLLLAGCCTKAPLDNRWAELAQPPVVGPAGSPDNSPQLWISSIPSDAPAVTPPPSATDSTAALIAIVAKLTNATVPSAKAGGATMPKGWYIDTTSLARTLVIAVSRNDFTTSTFNPADRLVRTRITIMPDPGSGFIFTNYTIAATAYTTTNIDNLSLTHSSTLSAELDPTLAGLIKGTGKFGATSANSATDTASISAQIENLTVWVDDKSNSLIVYRQSERGLDLTGTTLIKLSLTAKDSGRRFDIGH